MDFRNREFRAKTFNVTCTVDEQVYTLYTCPPTCRSHVVLLYVKAAEGSPSVTVEWDRADGSHAHILSDKNLTTGEFIQWSGSYIVLEPGDSITVMADEATPHLDAFCTVEEHYLPNRPGLA
jgi:hypothetical protein